MVRKLISSNIERDRYEYWSAFNDYAKRNLAFSDEFIIKKPNIYTWMALRFGVTDCHISILQTRSKSTLSVGFYVDNKKDYYILYKSKKLIEKELGYCMDWDEMPNYKSSKIIISRDVDFNDKSDRNNQFEWIIINAIKIKNIFTKYL